MTRHLLTLALIAATTVPQLSAKAIEHGNRDIYGFYLNNENGFDGYQAGAYGFARQKMNRLQVADLIYPMGGNQAIYAAAAIDGLYYVAPYLYQTMNFPEPLPMFTYNIYNGEVRELGPWVTEDGDFKVNDMTYDIKNDRLLAVGYGPVEGTALYEVNRVTGAMTLLVHLPEGVGGTVACDAFGRVFSIDLDCNLYQIDLTHERRATLLTKLPFSSPMAKQSMEFDHTCNKLYWGANTNENPYGTGAQSTYLVEITLPTISPDVDYTAQSGKYECEVINELGKFARYTGMYIPYCIGGFEAPGFAVNPTFTSTPDGKSCTLTFTAPTKAFDGETDVTVNGADIYRDGVKVGSVENLSAGQQGTYTDNTVPGNGSYKYDIVCYNYEQGDGPKTPVFAYVGNDAPKAVDGIKVNVAEGFRSVTLSWDAPTTGDHGGYFDPSKTTYSIKRLPDNYVVAENLKETTLTDSNIRRLLRYSYEITATNEYGSTKSVSESFIAGQPVSDLPLEESFENPTALQNQWTLIDNNNDAFTWMLGADYGHSIFGDYEMTAEYFVSPTTSDGISDPADEWIITPPVKFEDGAYHVTFSIRSLSNERLNVYAGPRPATDGMEKFATFTLNEPKYASDEQGALMLFQDYTFQLPESVNGKDACIALQLNTPINEMRYHYIQVGNITVDAGTSIRDINVEDADLKITTEGGILNVAGKFNQGAIYTIGGVKVMDITAPQTDLNTLGRGIYILNIDGRSIKLAL